MRSLAASLLVVALLAGCERGGEQPTEVPAAEPGTPADELESAERIVTRIIALKHRYARLRGINDAEHVSRSDDGRSVDLRFSRGVSYGPNPDCQPGAKCSQLATFAADGAELSVYLSLDPWRGTAAVLPYQIGELHVVTFVDGPDTEAMRRLSAEIQRIIDEERDAFEASAR